MLIIIIKKAYELNLNIILELKANLNMKNDKSNCKNKLIN